MSEIKELIDEILFYEKELGENHPIAYSRDEEIDVLKARRDVLKVKWNGMKIRKEKAV